MIEPSKQDLERAATFCEKNSIDEIVIQWLAAEFAAIRRERDEAAEKLAEAAEPFASRTDYFDARDLQMKKVFIVTSGHQVTWRKSSRRLREALASYRAAKGERK